MVVLQVVVMQVAVVSVVDAAERIWKEFKQAMISLQGMTEF